MVPFSALSNRMKTAVVAVGANRFKYKYLHQTAPYYACCQCTVHMRVSDKCGKEMRSLQEF